jgi:H+-translocating NAD(P) transhydrogenase subunit beta
MTNARELFIALSYLLASTLFIVGLKRLSSPATARAGNTLAGVGMLLAIVATLLAREIIEFQWILVGLAAGTALGVVMAVRVKMTSMPQMVGILNAFGGGASTLVALAEYLFTPDGRPIDVTITIALTTLVGAVTFSGSFAAAAKLQEMIPGRAIIYPLQKTINAALFLGILAIAAYLAVGPYSVSWLTILTIASLLLGILVVLPIGGADMPVVISLMNSYSGIAGALAGFVLRNNALIISGALVGASGIILTKIMCQGRRQNRA